MPFGRIFNPRRPKRDFFHRSCQSGKQVQTRAVPTNGFLRTNFYPKCFLHNSMTFLWRPRPLLPTAVDYQRQGHRTGSHLWKHQYHQAIFHWSTYSVNYPVWSPYFLGSSMYVVIRVLRKSDQDARLFSCTLQSKHCMYYVCRQPTKF